MHKISLRYLPFLQTFGHLMCSRHTYHEPDPHWRARVCDVGPGMVTAANVIVSPSTIDKMFEIYTFFENTTEIYTFFKNRTEIYTFFENRFEIYTCILFENRTEILSMVDGLTIRANLLKLSCQSQ